MRGEVSNPIVHLELHTGNMVSACAFYGRLLGWRTELVHTSSGDYLTLGIGDRIEGGIVEHDTQRPSWLPYAEVANIHEVTERARLLGASVCLPPREGPAGWRSVLVSPSGGMIALWQAKP